MQPCSHDVSCSRTAPDAIGISVGAIQHECAATVGGGGRSTILGYKTNNT